MALRRIQVPVNLTVDLDSNAILMDAVNDGRSEVNVQPSHAFGVQPSFTMRNNGGRMQIGGSIRQPMMLDIGYPEGAAPALKLPDIRGFISNMKTNVNTVVFTVVGAGGTGGYVIRDMLRFLQSLKGKGDTRQFVVNLVDADKVEQKNLIRQNFINIDVDKNKAAVLANRYGAAYGIPVIAHEKMLEHAQELTEMYNSAKAAVNSGNQSSAHIIIGCVDNHAARRIIHAYVNNTRHIYWIDSGNERTSGQVVLGWDRFMGQYRGYGQKELEQTLPQFGSEAMYALPTVVDLYPEILDPKQDLAGSDNTSCAERAQIEDQNIFINVSAALNVLNFVRQIVMSEKIIYNAITFDIRGLSQVTNLTPENLAKIATRR